MSTRDTTVLILAGGLLTAALVLRSAEVALGIVGLAGARAITDQRNDAEETK